MSQPEVAELTCEQANFAIKKICQWMNTCEDNKRYPVTSADVSHSSLLYRLLLGRPLLEKPPPRRYSYPCYDLAEGKEVPVHHVREDSKFVQLYGSEYADVSVDQGLEYTWQDKAKQILKHLPTGDLYQLSEREIVVKDLHGKEIVEMQKFMQKIDVPQGE